MHLFLETRPTFKPKVSVFISRKAFIIRVYNLKFYVWFVLTFWNYTRTEKKVWLNPQMDFKGNYRGLKLKTKKDRR